MKLTKTQLKQLIKEELNAVILEQSTGALQCKTPRGIYGKLFLHIQQYCKWLPRGMPRVWRSHWIKGLQNPSEGDECPGKQEIQELASAFCNFIHNMWLKWERSSELRKVGVAYLCNLDDESCKNLRTIVNLSKKHITKTERNPRWALKYLRMFGPEVLSPGASPCGNMVKPIHAGPRVTPIGQKYPVRLSGQ